MNRNNRQDRSMCFQNLHRKEYFEGWYYKQVSPDQKTVICLIPGISIYKGKSNPFIQINLTQKMEDTWHQTTDWLDCNALTAQDKPFLIQLDGNQFRRDGITIAYHGKRMSVLGTLGFRDAITPPGSMWAPTMMGPFAFLPGMECIHSVISLNHTIEGSLQINGRLVDFTQGKGYIEKDWGSSFPKRYVWIQSNHFSQEGSLFFSWADIPVFGTFFHGYIAHLYYQGKHHRFATYTSGRCNLQAGKHSVEVLLTNRDYELQIAATRAAGAELIAPHRGKMIQTIKEGLYGQLSFCLKQRSSAQTQTDRTEIAGIEIVMPASNIQG